jgi:hypothetical protein
MSTMAEEQPTRGRSVLVNDQKRTVADVPASVGGRGAITAEVVGENARHF